MGTYQLGCFISCSEDIEFIDHNENPLITVKNTNANTSKIYYYPPPPAPPAINRPVGRLLKKWMNDPTIGIWIDEKRVDNSVLRNYTSSEFSLYYVRGLKKEHEDYGKLKLTVELTTNNYYSIIKEHIKQIKADYEKKYPNGKVYPLEESHNDIKGLILTFLGINF